MNDQSLSCERAKDCFTAYCFRFSVLSQFLLSLRCLIIIYCTFSRNFKKCDSMPVNSFGNFMSFQVTIGL